MAVTLSNPLGGSVLATRVKGNQKHVVVTVMDTSYATGGTVILPADLGLVQIDSMVSTSSVAGNPTCPKFAAGVWSVLFFSAVGTEATNATDISANTYVLEVVGR